MAFMFKLKRSNNQLRFYCFNAMNESNQIKFAIKIRRKTLTKQLILVLTLCFTNPLNNFFYL